MTFKRLGSSGSSKLHVIYAIMSYHCYLVRGTKCTYGLGVVVVHSSREDNDGVQLTHASGAAIMKWVLKYTGLIKDYVHKLIPKYQEVWSVDGMMLNV